MNFDDIKDLAERREVRREEDLKMFFKEMNYHVRSYLDAKKQNRTEECAEIQYMAVFRVGEHFRAGLFDLDTAEKLLRPLDFDLRAEFVREEEERNRNR